MRRCSDTTAPSPSSDGDDGDENAELDAAAAFRSSVSGGETTSAWATEALLLLLLRAEDEEDEDDGGGRELRSWILSPLVLKAMLLLLHITCKCERIENSIVRDILQSWTLHKLFLRPDLFPQSYRKGVYILLYWYISLPPDDVISASQRRFNVYVGRALETN